MSITTREQKGHEIAAKKTISFTGRVWIVPSQTGFGKYQVLMDKTPTCNCPDFELRNQPCKHIYAVEFTIKHEVHEDGSSTNTKTVKVSYTQNWPAYNAAQTQEKEYFEILLSNLCKTLPEPVRTQGQAPGGRKPLPYSDMTFAATLKVYSTLSARKFSTDLRETQAKGLIFKAPHFNSVLNHLEREDLTEKLKGLIIESSKPLTAIENQFAVDSQPLERTLGMKRNTDQA
ncbi:SWIM zinc finger family protein [Candidatus Acetothermia bacterium]|nr:SWIM zinc finger family protein [Candidatus Acetothermia bacterium]MBI3643504.1 SWIM zinc finger family protein [Candidatus Acetothermia bacterium]